ncbi:MAG: hypothetical protein QM650_01895 [Microlunatus sp.]
MADAYQVILGMVAVSVIVLVPIGMAVAYDALAGRSGLCVSGLRNRWRARTERRRDLRTMRRQQGVPLERLTNDLRRLRALVSSDEHQSAAHQLGHRLAYDRVLTDICAMLDLSHDLNDELAGLDRDIERIRIEADLERVGVVLTDKRYGKAA